MAIHNRVELGVGAESEPEFVIFPESVRIRSVPECHFFDKNGARSSAILKFVNSFSSFFYFFNVFVFALAASTT